MNEGLVGMERTIRPMERTVQEIKAEFERLSVAASNDKMLKVLVMVTNKMKEASQQIVELKTKVGELECDLGAAKKATVKTSPTEDPSPKTPDAMDELIHMLDDGAKVCDDVIDPFVTPERVGAGGRKREPSISPTPGDGAVKALLEEVKSLRADVAFLKITSEDKSVKFGGLGIRSIQECHAWIQENFVGYRYGLVMDPLLMLDRIFGSDDIEADSQFKSLESRVKLKITTGSGHQSVALQTPSHLP